MGAKHGSVAERIERNSIPEPNCGCWLWTGSVMKNGYACIRVGGQTVRAHRAAYEAHKGPIPAGAMLLHRCDVPVCVNPDHLRPGTFHHNMVDRCRKGRTRAKLTPGQVEDIQSRRYPAPTFAAMYGVTRQAVHYVQKHRRGIR